MQNSPVAHGCRCGGDSSHHRGGGGRKQGPCNDFRSQSPVTYSAASPDSAPPAQEQALKTGVCGGDVSGSNHEPNSKLSNDSLSKPVEKGMRSCVFILVSQK